MYTGDPAFYVWKPFSKIHEYCWSCSNCINNYNNNEYIDSINRNIKNIIKKYKKNLWKVLTNMNLSVIINSTKNKTPYQTSTPHFLWKRREIFIRRMEKELIKNRIRKILIKKVNWIGFPEGLGGKIRTWGNRSYSNVERNQKQYFLKSEQKDLYFLSGWKR